MSEERLVPKLRFEGFTDKWKSVKLGDIFSFYSTNSFSREKLNYDEGNVKNIHYGDIHTKFPTILSISKNEEVPYINDDVDLSRFKEEQYLQEGDLVIADASEDYDDIGKAIEVKNINDEKVLAGLHTILARDEKNITVNGFKGYLFLTNDLKTNIKRIANGISVLGISKNNLSKLNVNIPSKSEQQEIVNLFSSIDKKIELLEQKHENYQNFKKYLMQQIFEQKLRFNEFDDEWKKIKLKDADITISDGNYGEAYPKQEDFKNEGIPFIRAVNIVNSKLTLKDMRYISESLHNTLLQGHLKENDILFTNRGDIGLVAYVTKEFENSNINAQICLLRVNDKNINAKYLFYLLTNPYVQRQVLKYQTGSALKQLPKKSLGDFELLIPSYNEQVKIVGILTEYDKKIDLIEDELLDLHNFKKGLLQQMFV